MTGTPAATMAWTRLRTRTPPSSLTAWAPAFMSAAAEVTARASEASYEPKGRSATTRGRWVPRATAATSGSISSRVTGNELW
jgi:hypothetical protein